MASSESLKKHISLVHEDGGFECKHCQRKLNSKAALRGHIRRVHEGHKDHVCEHCGKGFTFSLSMKCHIRNIHKVSMPELPEYKCQQCGFISASSSNLYNHIKRVHEGIRQYTSCTKCEKVFKGKSAMLRHYEIIHEGIKKFICKICAKAFGQRVELKLHVSRFHKEALNEETQKPVSELSCQYCDKTFSMFYSLNQHINIVHKNNQLVLPVIDEKPTPNSKEV